MNELPWFRFYTDFLTNGRIRLLSFDDRCHYVTLLCLKASGGLNEFANDADMQLMRVAKALELSISAADEARHRLMRVGLIDDSWEPTGWDDRQFRSDSSKDRVRKFREKKSKEKQRIGKVKRPCNVTVTAQESDTDTDTDTDTEKERPESLNAKAWDDYVEHRKELRKRLTDRGAKMAMTALAKLPHEKQQDVVNLTIQNGWTGLFPERCDEAPKRSHSRSFDEIHAEVRRKAGLA